MRQITVLVGTTAAVAGVLAFPEGAIVPAQMPNPPIQAAQKSEPFERRPAAILFEEKILPAIPPRARPPVFLEVAKQRSMRVVKPQSVTAPKNVEAKIDFARAPASDEVFAEDPQPGFRPHSELSFVPEVSYLRIDGQGNNASSAKLLSNMNLGADFSWRQNWTEKAGSYLTAGFSRIDFQGAPNNKTISQNGKTYGRFGLGASYCPSNRLQAGIGLALRQEIFYEATGASSLRVDKVMVPRAEASLSYDLFKLYPYGLGVGLRSAYLFPASANGYEVKAGTSHRFSLFIKEENHSGRLRPVGEVFYDLTKQNSSLHSKSEKELGLQIGLKWKFAP